MRPDISAKEQSLRGSRGKDENRAYEKKGYKIMSERERVVEMRKRNLKRMVFAAAILLLLVRRSSRRRRRRAAEAEKRTDRNGMT